MKKYIIAILITGLHASCEDALNKTPLDQISSQSFWKTEADFKLATNNLYSFLDQDVTVDAQTADYFQRGTNTVSSGTNVSANTDADWSNSYIGIRRANEILENLESSPLDPAVKNKYAGEARFFRAYLYFRMVQKFGDVILALKTLDFESEELMGAKATRSQIVDQIIADLQFSAQNTAAKKALAAIDKGRITRGAALGLLSRVALYEGTHEKYHSHGTPNARLEIAKKAALDFINENEYPLIADFSKLYSEDNENHSEVVFSKFFKENITGVSPLGRGLVVDEAMMPTLVLANSFLCTDGLPIQASTLFKGYSSLTSEFENRDARMEVSIWKPGTNYGSTPLLPDFKISSTGYYVKKPGDPKALSVTNIYTDQILMRSAEVLLNYAEATYELTGAISDADLDLSINKLRKRVGMPNLTNAFVRGGNPASLQLNMLDEIRRERRIELAGEGFRRNDLVRWKLAEKELTGAILGVKFQQASYPKLVVGKDISVDPNGFILAQTAATRFFVAPKNYLFPVPLREIALNSKLTQNTGW